MHHGLEIKMVVSGESGGLWRGASRGGYCVSLVLSNG